MKGGKKEKREKTGTYEKKKKCLFGLFFVYFQCYLILENKKSQSNDFGEEKKKTKKRVKETFFNSFIKFKNSFIKVALFLPINSKLTLSM